MDLVGELPRTQRGHDSIWMIVDRLIKYANFLLVKSTYKAVCRTVHLIYC